MRIAVLVLALAILVVYGEKPKAQSDTHGQNPTHAAPQADNAAGGSVIVVNQQTPHGQENSHPNKPPSYLHELLLPQNLPNLALVIVAAVTGWFIARQAREMARATKEMQAAGKQTERIIATMTDTAVRELRAYVGITTARITFFQERAPLIEILIKNSGKTPAYDAGMWISGRLGPYPLDMPLPPPPAGFLTSRSILAPGEEPHAMVWKHPIIDEDDMPILGTPELTIFIFGEIVYRDAFGYPRFTRFRLLYGGVERANRWDENGVAVTFLRADTEGNEAN
jgi:hypothetical protein